MSQDIKDSVVVGCVTITRTQVRQEEFKARKAGRPVNGLYAAARTQLGPDPEKGRTVSGPNDFDQATLDAHKASIGLGGNARERRRKRRQEQKAEARRERMERWTG